MKRDVLVWAGGRPSGKMVSKETLNHRGLIELVSGLDARQRTREAYLCAYEALGIDLVNRVPVDNAPVPTPEGETRDHPQLPYRYSHLGLYDAAVRRDYLCHDPEDVWSLDLGAIDYGDLITPVPHGCRPRDIRLRQRILGSVGVYYPMLYTTLFMWAVEVLGWETFLLAAASDPQRFHEHFFLPCVEKSKAIVRCIASASDCPFVFTHDDLASATGPIFAPHWYDEFIFPHYPEIWAEAKKQGKRIVMVADGNMEVFLERLVNAGADGLMFESPATPLASVFRTFGRAGRFLIGGIDTARLTAGTPGEIRAMVLEVAELTAAVPGWAISSCGGLHGNIPLENLEAYFDARAEIGVTPQDWRTRCRA